MVRVHTLWSKGDLVRILTAHTKPESPEISIERHYSDWGKDVTKHTMFLSWRAEQDDRWLDQFVRLIKGAGGREDWRYFRKWDDAERSITMFCKMAKKSGFTCHKAITLNGVPVGVHPDDVQAPTPNTER